MTTRRIRKTLLTDSGMWAVWEPAYFPGIVDYDSWEKELLEDADIIRHIRAGAFVPINLHFDGAYDFELRIGTFAEPAELSQREKDLLTVSSLLYKLNVHGQIYVSGLEYIGEVIEEELTACLAASRGTYAVSVHMIEWDKEEGAKDGNGQPGPNALPDFVILANPVADVSDIEYSQSLETFPNPEDLNMA